MRAGNPAGSIVEFARDFHANFRDLGSHTPFVDVVLLAATGKVHLDVLVLDDAIIRKHGDYEGSMEDRVAVLYGAAAVTFVRCMIGGG